MFSSIHRKKYRWLFAGMGLLAIVFALGLWTTDIGARVLRRARVLPMYLPPGNQVSYQPATASSLPRVEDQNVVMAGKLYVFGGFYNRKLEVTTHSDVYDPSTDQWTRIADLPIAVTHAGLASDGETAWLAGGFVGDHPGKAVADVWKYDPASDEWTPGPSLPEPRASGGLAMIGRNLHYIGGLEKDRQTDSADHWVLSLDNGHEWSAKAPLPVPRNHLSFAVHRGKIYALGGQTGHDGPTEEVADAHVYDPISDRWEAIAPLAQPRSHFEPGTFVAGGKVVIAGGQSGDLPLLYAITAYDPLLDSWQELPALPLPLRSPLAKAIGQEVIIGNGGGLPNGFIPNEKMFRCSWKALGLDSEPVSRP